MGYLSKNVLFLAALCLVFGLAMVTVEAGPKERCANQKDDDGDGLVDCDDPDCFEDPDCTGEPPENCNLQFNGSFAPDLGVWKDEWFCNDDSNFHYCHGDQKVLVDSSIADGRALFTFESQTGPVKKKNENERKAWIDLTNFTVSPRYLGDGCWSQLEPSAELCPFETAYPFGEKQIRMAFYAHRGGLNLCDLCYGPDCTETCYMGHEYDVQKLGEEPCGEGFSSRRGAVGLYLAFFPVDGARLERMALIYNTRWHGGDPPGEDQCPNALPVVVERVDSGTWKITGTNACLISGGVDAEVLVDDGNLANFELTIEAQ
jgi:hypothetical protein